MSIRTRIRDWLLRKSSAEISADAVEAMIGNAVKSAIRREFALRDFSAKQDAENNLLAARIARVSARAATNARACSDIPPAGSQCADPSGSEPSGPASL